MRRCSGSLYEALHVEKEATPSDIKKAYYKLALQLHPDKTGGATTEEFKKIQEANAILSDPEMRQKYDMFGKEGLQQLSSMGVPAEYLNVMVIRAVMLLTLVFSMLYLIWAALVVARIDHHPTWEWGAVWTPVWLICIALVVIAVPITVQGVTNKNLDLVSVGGMLALILVCNAVFVAALDDRLSWSQAAVPFFVFYCVEIVRSIVAHRFSRFQEFHQMFPSTDSDGLSGPCHPLYLTAIAWEVWRIATNLAFMIALYLRATKPEYAALDFYRIATPLILRFIVAVLHMWYMIWTVGHREPISKKLVSMITASLVALPPLYTICMIASKANAMLNLDGSYNPSAAVCAVFVFIGMSALVLGSCMAACCVSLESMEAAQQAAYEQQADAADATTPSNEADGDGIPPPYQNVV
ncbi:DNA-J chaperone, putative [Bodo saltans]|uniref:DNA-J chaperone, putative n=1 Tax=Bodo saltans TaxID=75058 RepID=A0A0S4JJT4_BODSA|nr:DNA-J chaperone, putative [Bodo saltans]|eukprot:CUG91719.1 DNA-J chaperone, putative [Bodo saltans]